MPILQLYLIDWLIEDYSVNPPAARVAIVCHNGLAYQSVLNSGTLFLLGFVGMDIIKIIDVAEHSFGPYDLGGRVDL
jgi:hypothetical protein